LRHPELLDAAHIEEDGPTLQHALQGINGADLILPTKIPQRPDAELLQERYERFREAG
jgi:hypothetical protein